MLSLLQSPSGFGSRLRPRPRRGGREILSRLSGHSVLSSRRRSEAVRSRILAVVMGLLAGHVLPPFGGPATTALRLTLSAQGQGTLLKIRDDRLGALGGDSPTEGWRIVFDNGLRQYLESGRDNKMIHPTKFGQAPERGATSAELTSSSPDSFSS